MTEQIKFYRDKHLSFIESLDTKTEDYEYWLSEHLRINGVYWGLTALCCLKASDKFKKKDVIEFVLSCWDKENGSFAPFKGHDAHLLSTLSAVQILAIYDSISVLSPEMVDSIVKFVTSNQLEDGSFQGDEFGEVDTRFTYNALSTLSILGKLTPQVVDPAVSYIKNCYNFDGGFGLCPGAESHSAQAFTCVGALAIVGKLEETLTKQQLDDLGWWLCERQVDNGGLNGRPSKLPDVCYSWWVLSTLAIIGKLDWINFPKLHSFILKSQDPQKGGISDRPGNEVDVYHTCFGIAGLSLMGVEDLEPIDPVYCMPFYITKKFLKYK
ncbi:probable Geranylgeranyl transferase type-2 subunit beta [Saccharomycodes ludwigii]|uniref:Geranylgeranyl transferase type-2 subunit beta n=1 Tax=Saccharomycodes ludwigii TaxID=36035 RepID=A0A376B734_9ASCO|nr:hypothetical protein SCDLUD_000027 [Saccharomycodes ludwigii]KAH3902450.1 hypothetical protein SCDLUD_000027 [Saccharomycodes ludwigii]SSD60478.1 probable Geranylgeranyl transferase type-2 subunit beta [Saccharomycodes ludwigii]